MVTHIQFHRSCITGGVPDSSVLYEGEPAVNLRDKKLWVKGCENDLVNFIGGETASLGSLYVDQSLFASDVTKLGISAGANISLSTVTDGNEKRIVISSEDFASVVAGEDKQVQFNNGNTFGTDSEFVYDKDANRLGVGTSSPRSSIETNGVVMGAGFSGATGTLTTSLGVGTKTPRQVVEVIGTLAASGISADGITAGGTVTFGANVNMPTQYSTIGQDNSKIQFNGAGNQMILNAPTAVDFYRKIRHQGDTDTFLEFTTDNIKLAAGNSTLLEGNANGVLHVPTGISGGGATFGDQVRAEAGVSASSLSINNAYSLPAADGSAGQAMMTDGADALTFQTIKFSANFVLDSDVPLVTGTRDKALYYIPYDNAVLTEVLLRSEDASASGDSSSLAVAIEGIQRTTGPGGLNDANPTTGSTILTVTIDETADEDHLSAETGLTHAIGVDNNIRSLRLNITDNSGNHTNLQVMLKMEARTT